MGREPERNYHIHHGKLSTDLSLQALVTSLPAGGGLLGPLQSHRAGQQAGSGLRLLALQGGSQTYVGGREVRGEWDDCEVTGSVQEQEGRPLADKS